MKRLLFQSDDYGITDAVTDGIIHGILNGVIRNTGLFVNMPSSARAVEKIKGLDVCFGIDINYVCGRPVSDPKDVPALVNEDGSFISSRQLLASRKPLFMTHDVVYNFEEDPYPYDQIYLETENQVKHFIEMTGKLPEYIHPHSVCTPNTEKAAAEVAGKYGIYHSTDMMFGDAQKCVTGRIEELKGKGLEDQLNVDVTDMLINSALPTLQDGETGYFMCHCGYVDRDLFQVSSLTLRRAADLYAATNPVLIKYLEENDIRLITYRDL